MGAGSSTARSRSTRSSAVRRADRSAHSTLLLLADGRLPSGGHAHSGGLEEAVVDGRVFDAVTLAAWLAGRLATAGRVDASLAAATLGALTNATADADDEDAGGTRDLDSTARLLAAVARLDAEAAARCPSPALRRASRAQGRGLVRAGRRMWPGDLLDELFSWRADGPMWPTALGTVGFATGLDGPEVALVAAHSSLSGPAWAATRLLGLDPFAVARCLADLAGDIDALAEMAAAASAASGGDGASLDAHGAPLIEIGAQAHADWEVRLFAS